MTTATAPAKSERKPMPFADRVRLHPRAGDVFTAEACNVRFRFEVDFIASPWVFYKKSIPGDVRCSKLKVRLGSWRVCLERAKIKQVEA
jgi:hypothetical protein